ncbi:MAG: universal stress protein [Bacteroidia bacterium]|nr:universal stress protein [Bacteroidia bacterium]MBT8309888.1 universal stress protein [Bacteroidia bacterium]NND10490.1 universal stress protein [Flavobacteriaceae bacterium]NNK27844.1 universal stress protein [Flavobacteriaceae bacterium]NNL60600.1 universal stress protein [Flavobacteriaceae bacterium]
MKNILVSIDFKGNEKPLLDKALEIARAFDAKIWLVHIAAPDPDFVGYDVGPQSVRDARANKLKKEHKLIEDFTKDLRHKDAIAEGLLIQGATIETVIKESKKLKADLIITGHEEHGFLYRALLGSVSSQLIKKSKIPVLIVPLD